MPEYMVRLMLSELTKIRLICQGVSQNTGQPCGVVQEVPIERLVTLFNGRDPTCPGCGTSFGGRAHTGQATDPYREMAEAMHKILQLDQKCKVEFVLTAAEYTALPGKSWCPTRIAR